MIIMLLLQQMRGNWPLASPVTVAKQGNAASCLAKLHLVPRHLSAMLCMQTAWQPAGLDRTSSIFI
jgi:hypothetical protein